MKSPNPPSKDIDIQTQEGLELLKIKAKYYGHYAEQLRVLDLIKEIEKLKKENDILQQFCSYSGQ